MVKKILLYYCTVLAFFLNISGFLNAKQTNDYLLQFVFLPITAFLLINTFKSIFAPQKEKKTNTSAGKPVIAFVLFFLLLAVSLLARLNLSPHQEILSPLSSLPTASAPTSVPEIFIPQKITIKTENPQFMVNIRQEPASASAVLLKVKSGTIFSCLDIQEGWYKIEYKDGQTGWVFGQYAAAEENQ